MTSIQTLRTIEPAILVLGSYSSIIQSILDFDFLSKKKEPSVKAIIASGRNYERYFWGKREILIPVYSDPENIPTEIKGSMNMFLNLSSGRRALSSTLKVFKNVPEISGGAIFAEDVPEKHALELYEYAKVYDKFIVGPASVGLLLPGVLKLGAIGGVEAKQIVQSNLLTKGTVAVFSASGGTTNELIYQVARASFGLSFALHFGGDRFPVTFPAKAFELALQDPDTKAIVYFGELGGTDEHEVAQLLKESNIKKHVICYIAGTVAELFETPPQFGHAKALAQNDNETARKKREILKDAGANVAETFDEFIQMIENLLVDKVHKNQESDTIQTMDDRRHALIATSISKDEDGEVKVLGENLLTFAQDNSFAFIATSLFLGRKAKSTELVEFVDFVLKLLVDHGPYVSGAVNTIITSRAGKDLTSALAAGLLTIGPRFGGAINQAALNWLQGVDSKTDAADFVEDFADRKEYISGIGHKKYRVDMPDPRVATLLTFVDSLSDKKYTKFAIEVEAVTAAKKGNLILNVDGAIAAVMLDILSEKEGMSGAELEKLAQAEFFNAFFVLSRSTGFIAHFLDQKRLDEGIFRLDEDQVAEAKI